MGELEGDGERAHLPVGEQEPGRGRDGGGVLVGEPEDGREGEGANGSVEVMVRARERGGGGGDGERGVFRRP